MSGKRSRIGSRRSWSISPDQIGRVVGLHVREQSRRVGVAARLEELQLVRGVELFEDVGLEFAVGGHGLDDLLTLIVTGLFDQVGDLCGVQFGELAIRNSQPSRRARARRTVRSTRSRRWPRTSRGLPTLVPRIRRRSERLPGSTPTTSQRVVDLGDLDLVRRDQAATDQVDQVAGEQVLREQQFTGASLKSTKVHPLALEGQASLVKPLTRA